MTHIVPDPADIIRQIRALPEDSFQPYHGDRRKRRPYSFIYQPELESQFPGARCIGIECKNGERRISMAMTGPARCPKCGKLCDRVHGYVTRFLRDCPTPGNETTLIQLEIRRVRCSCNFRGNEQIPWLLPRRQLTLQFRALLQDELRNETAISKIARAHCLSFHTVKNIDMDQLLKYYDEVDVSHVRRIAIDEFALEKGHKYATTFMDLDTGAIFYVVKGRTVKAVEKGFKYLKDKGVLDQIQAVACDMNAAFPKLVAKYCKNADLVYDLFHVVAHFKEVIRRARLDIVGHLEEKARRAKSRLLRNIEWSMVMPRERLSEKHSKYLDKVLADNELLAALYPILGAVRSIWCAPSRAEAELQIDVAADLMREIKEKYGFPAAEGFADMLTSHKDGLLMAHKHRIGTNKLEGANNKIKVLKRIGYGYTDFKYFSLKIKSTICGTVNVMARYLRRGEAVMPDGIVLDAHLSLSIGRQLSRRSILRIQHRRKTYGPPRKAEQKSGNRFVTPACTVENYGKSA